MSNTSLIIWFFAVGAIGWTGGVVAGLRVGRAHPSKRALQVHDDEVLQQFAAKLSELSAARRHARAPVFRDATKNGGDHG